ncbi:MAG: IS4 family transposase [Longibaculum sp.]
MNNARYLKQTLLNLVNDLSLNHREFLFHPNSDFSRNRKLPFETVIQFILCMEASPIKDELYNHFGLNINIPSASAFVQQRGKINYEAFQWLFESFNSKTYKSENNLYKGYRLLAIDGCSTPIRTDVNDKKTYVDRHSMLGYNAYHLNALYDLMEHTYNDVIVQDEPSKDENDAFYKLVDRYNGSKAIFIADRGYESYNGFEHVVHSGNKYLIRVKDITSRNCMTQTLGPYPDQDEFDIDVSRILTLKQTNTIKENPQFYRFISNKSTFDYMDKNNPFYEFDCRIVRFKIADDTYECVITNLDRDEFPAEEIKRLYNLRWGIETSFRELKYAVCLNAFHSKKHNSIKQEIYARLLFYNFSERIMRHVKPKASRRKRKYSYQINFTRAFHNIREFLRYKKGGKLPPDIESIIAKEIEPIRPGRSSPRNVRCKPAEYFIYRLN